MKPTRVRLVTGVMIFVAACTPVPQPGQDAGMMDGGSLDAGTADAGDSQERYTYPGCDDAGTYHCPRSNVFVCALNSIREKYVSCQMASDCVAVSATNCFDHLTDCPPAAVNDAGAAAFLVEANAEGERYCDGGKCRGAGSCAFSYQRRLVDCTSGRCVALQDDGGIF